MKIVIIYGSANDQAFMQPGRDYMDKEKVAYEERVLSAHRNHAELAEYLKELNASGEKIVIVAVAGLSAALPGVVPCRPSIPWWACPSPEVRSMASTLCFPSAKCPDRCRSARWACTARLVSMRACSRIAS